MLTILDNTDTSFFLFINGLHNEFFDVFMVYVSSKFFWLPLYVFLLFLLYKKFNKQIWLVLLFIVILISASDQLSVHAFKNVFERLRPCHTPDLLLIVNTVDECGGKFGFVSSHAANSFALAFFISGLLRGTYKWVPWIMYTWAFLTIYSRVYLGVHFPGDVLAGALLGIVIGWFILIGYRYTARRVFPQKA